MPVAATANQCIINQPSLYSEQQQHGYWHQQQEAGHSSSSSSWWQPIHYCCQGLCSTTRTAEELHSVIH
jgi:hypothetical protein